MNKFDPPKTKNKKPTNLSLDHALLTEAKALEINLSNAAEDGLRLAVAKARAQAWQQENALAIQSSNEWVKKNGLPLEKHRNF